MKGSLIRLSCVAVLCCIANTALASDPINEYQWQGATINFGFHTSIPGACSFVSLDSSNAWNGVGSNFSIIQNLFFSSPRVADQTPSQNNSEITVEDDTLSPPTIMETKVTHSGVTIVNADIYVSTAMLDPTYGAAGKFTCIAPSTVPPDKLDWVSAMTHELGHAVGFQLTSEYYDDDTCVCIMASAWGRSVESFALRRNLSILVPMAGLM